MLRRKWKQLQRLNIIKEQKETLVLQVFMQPRKEGQQRIKIFRGPSHKYFYVHWWRRANKSHHRTWQPHPRPPSYVTATPPSPIVCDSHTRLSTHSLFVYVPVLVGRLVNVEFDKLKMWKITWICMTYEKLTSVKSYLIWLVDVCGVTFDLA